MMKKKYLPKRGLDSTYRKQSIETKFYSNKIISSPVRRYEQRSMSIQTPPMSLDHKKHNMFKMSHFRSSQSRRRNAESPTLDDVFLKNSTLLLGESTEGQPEVSIFEGSVYQHKPGLKIDAFHEKYMKVTNKALYTYKDQYSANLFDSKPHLTVPFELVKSVQKVKLIVNKCKNKSRDKNWAEFQYNFVVNLDLKEIGIDTEPLEKYTSASKRRGSKVSRSRNSKFGSKNTSKMFQTQRESTEEFFKTGIEQNRESSPN